ncbi:type 4a pilus biogenesis protein PilO [Herbaspirillum sp. RTI4]|uniref:type 4a pilus biogenesis protein PilO n=1 Tax=Herbaspirillum sp. RTI4 TaxID=3048640 RepID=UPI002AB46E3C|nr:type 4a pilus biogenesis protein PilO [Herbaspirillum sp. RTI4]MDY7576873.1 type 4a pilus biogenesis protein PilO [Herbaspirillum sp. RTI4]MEA9982520.1 type 4a pilus biogenesis protein PilO [Herbaspirillum sp. RTI4]
MNKLISSLPALKEHFLEYGSTLRHPPGQWPLRWRAACLSVLFILLLAGGWVLLILPQGEALQAASMRELAMKEDYRSKLQQAVNLNAATTQRKLSIGTRMQTLDAQLPQETTSDTLLSELTRLGATHGLRFEKFKPGATALREHYAELPLAIVASGSYKGISDFLADVAAMSHLVTLSELHVQARPQNGDLLLEANATAYRRLDSEITQAKGKQ